MKWPYTLTTIVVEHRTALTGPKDQHAQGQCWRNKYSLFSATLINTSLHTNPSRSVQKQMIISSEFPQNVVPYVKIFSPRRRYLTLISRRGEYKCFLHQAHRHSQAETSNKRQCLGFVRDGGGVRRGVTPEELNSATTHPMDAIT